MRLSICIVLLFITKGLLGQNKQVAKQPIRYIDVYKTADSLYNQLQKSGIDTILFYHLLRNSSETYQSNDNTSDHVSAYLFWQTADSAYMQKINAYTIYKVEAESRRMQQYANWAIATIFDYYKAKKQILDKQEFRPDFNDLTTIDKIIGKDTMWLFGAFSCFDCFGSTLKYKIGKTQVEKNWDTMYLERGNEFFTYNISSELYHWLLITNQVMAHTDRNKWWQGTKYKY